MAAARAVSTSNRASTALRASVGHGLIEYNILLTATLCLLAAGTVMVYSASSAPSLLQGRQWCGDGDQVRRLWRGGAGAMRVFARRGLDLARRMTGPLLAVSFVLVLAVHVPTSACRSTAPAAGSGPGRCSSSPPSS